MKKLSGEARFRFAGLSILGLVFFLLFLSLSVLVAQNIFTQVDLRFTIWIQNLLGNYLINFFSVFSFIGTIEVLSVILIVLLFFFSGVKRVYIVLGFVLVTVIELIGKTIINHPGPPIEFLKTETLISMPSGLVSAHFFSYPSGHSARTAFVSAILIFVIYISDKLSMTQKKILIGIVLIFDFIMFLSRVYLGEHFMSDVLGGVILGFSVAFIISYFLNLKASKN